MSTLESITAKLVEVGYGDEVEYLRRRLFCNPLFDLPAVNRPGPLTKRGTTTRQFHPFFLIILSEIFPVGWGSIKKSMITFMEFQRKKRLVDLAADELDRKIFSVNYAWQYSRSHDCSMFPRGHDFACIPVVRRLWDNDDEKLSREDCLETLEPYLPEIVRTWRDDIFIQLNDYLRSTSSNLPQDVDLTQLAMCNYFRCNRGGCYRSYFTPIPLHHLLSHRCLTERAEPEEFSGNMTEDALDFYFYSTRWSIGNTETFIEPMRNIIQACGRDPMTATAVEMDQLDVRIYCRKCEEEYPNSRIILSWRGAVSKPLSFPYMCLSLCQHDLDSPPDWRCNSFCKP